MKFKLFVGAMILAFTTASYATSICEIKATKDKYRKGYVNFSIQLDRVEVISYDDLDVARNHLRTLVEDRFCITNKTKSTCEIKASKDKYREGYVNYSIQLDGVEIISYYDLDIAKAKVRELYLGNICLNENAKVSVIEDLLNGTINDDDVKDLGEVAVDSFFNWLTK